MIRNYFLVAIRNLTRNKFFSAINIFGLAVSMSICMAIIMLVADQMLYDETNINRDRIYRINTAQVDLKGKSMGNVPNATSPMPLAAELKEKFTGIEKVARFKRGFGNGWIEFENQNVNIPLAGFYADPEALTLLGYELQYGDPVNALAAPYSVVLTRKASNKLFKEENPIGKTIKMGELGTFNVTGVLRETENKSHIAFEALASMATVKSKESESKAESELDNWMDFWSGWTYVLLEPGKTPEDLQASLDKIYETHIATNTNPDKWRAKFEIQSLTKITPGPFINNPIGPSLPWIFVYFLGGLAAVVMVTSCFNFTNLSIARSLKRAKEIGVRKVTGAARWQIFLQFISESVVVSLCALVLACGILVVLKPVMLQLNFARIFRWDLELNAGVYAVFFAFALMVGIFAGLFPAVVLSGFQPVKVLKGANTMKLFSKMGLRKTLLVSQFTISLVFILTVIIMYNQLQLFVTKDYGFNMKENMFIRLNNTSAEALKNELSKYNNVENVAGSSHIPSAGISYGDGFKKDLSEKEWTNLSYFVTDEDYLKNMEISLVAGKFFSAESGKSNSNFIVVNEQAVKDFHYKDAGDALGQEIIFQRDSTRKTIIGVVKDYNHGDLLSKIDGMALMYNKDEISLLQVRYKGTSDQAKATIEKAWAAVNPGLKVDHKGVEEEIKNFYNTIFGDIVNVLGSMAFLAIMISCLGLLGMATYSIETKMKEISVRKVLGSSDRQLVMLLSKGFLSMILIAIVIGVPAAYFINNMWLQLMAYHTHFDVAVIAIGVLVMFALAGLTIGSQTLRAAYTNPVDNLKSE
jgi:putative ABC transport system permease protein